MSDEVESRQPWQKPVRSNGSAHVRHWTPLDKLRRCIGPCRVSITPERYCSSCKQATVLLSDYIARRDG